MMIDDLLVILEQQKKDHGGEVRVTIDSLSHTWPPDSVIRVRHGEKVLVLNS